MQQALGGGTPKESTAENQCISSTSISFNNSLPSLQNTIYEPMATRDASLSEPRAKKMRLESQNETTPKDTEGSRPMLYCTWCLYRSIYSTSIRKHSIRHNTKTSLQCQHCSYSSPTEWPLKMHVVRDHHHEESACCQCRVCEVETTGKKNTTRKLLETITNCKEDEMIKVTENLERTKTWHLRGNTTKVVESNLASGSFENSSEQLDFAGLEVRELSAEEIKCRKQLTKMEENIEEGLRCIGAQEERSRLASAQEEMALREKVRQGEAMEQGNSAKESQLMTRKAELLQLLNEHFGRKNRVELAMRTVQCDQVQLRIQLSALDLRGLQSHTAMKEYDVKIQNLRGDMKGILTEIQAFEQEERNIEEEMIQMEVSSAANNRLLETTRAQLASIEAGRSYLVEQLRVNQRNRIVEWAHLQNRLARIVYLITIATINENKLARLDATQ